jgi:FtsZ-interacting cell division protein ZipA
MNRISLVVTGLIAIAILVHVSNFSSSIYADKCSQSKSSNTEKKCETKNNDKNEDNGNSNVIVENSNSHASEDKCAPDPEKNNNLLGEGPYSFPTDTLTLPG